LAVLLFIFTGADSQDICFQGLLFLTAEADESGGAATIGSWFGQDAKEQEVVSMQNACALEWVEKMKREGVSLESLRWPAGFQAASAQALGHGPDSIGHESHLLLMPQKAFTAQTALDLTMVALCQKASAATPQSPSFFKLSEQCKSLISKTSKVTARFKAAVRFCEDLKVPWEEVRRMASKEESMSSSMKALEAFLNETANIFHASPAQLKQCLNMWKMAESCDATVPGSEQLPARWAELAGPVEANLHKACAVGGPMLACLEQPMAATGQEVDNAGNILATCQEAGSAEKPPMKKQKTDGVEIELSKEAPEDTLEAPDDASGLPEEENAEDKGEEEEQDQCARDVTIDSMPQRSPCQH
jgi:hypothetical protein